MHLLACPVPIYYVTLNDLLLSVMQIEYNRGESDGQSNEHRAEEEVSENIPISSLNVKSL